MQQFWVDEEEENQDEAILEHRVTSPNIQFPTNTFNSLMQSFHSGLNISYQTMEVLHLSQQGTGLTESFAQVVLTEPHFDDEQSFQTLQINEINDQENLLQQSSYMKSVKVATNKRKIQKLKRRYSINHDEQTVSNLEFRKTQFMFTIRKK